VTALAYSPELVEEAVLLAERTLPAADRRAFRRERDRLYERSDLDERERQFRSLHRHWFVRLGLGRAVEQAIAESVRHVHRVREARIVGAIAQREEGADLVDRVVTDTGGQEPLLVIRLRPETLLDSAAVRALLRHELIHVADMLDPEFGYQRTLPPTGEGPSADTIVRDRYRVVWDVTIDGRLARAGRGTTARSARWTEFAATFPMLGDHLPDAFEAWFDCAKPTHAALAAFARAPAAAHEVPDEERAAIGR
jgi:hypothetical protein